MSSARVRARCPALSCLCVRPALFAILASVGLQYGVNVVEGQGREFPIAAIVAVEEAAVHSGPAQVHYPTTFLKRGEMVEVWRFDPGGWCAVRPDDAAFSMIPESATEDLGEDLARVTVDGVQAWVGTRLGPVDKPLWQVRLRAGETVEVLGRCTWPDPEGFSTVWLQIAPPDGEFRWIRRSDLQLPDDSSAAGWSEPDHPAADEPPRSPERPDAAPVRRDTELLPVAYQESPALDQAFPMDDPFAGLDASGPRIAGAETGSRNVRSTQPAPALDGAPDGPPLTDDRGWRPARRPFRLASATGFPDARESAALPGAGSPAPPPATAGPSFGTVPVAPQAAVQPTGDWMASVPAATFPTFGNERVSPDLANLDLQLSREIIKPPEYWNLDDLAREAIRLQSTAASDGERALAGRMVQKITQFQRTRASMLASSPQVSAAAVASRERPTGSGVASNPELDATWDAHGWLNELVRQGGQAAPAYVLQDDAGKITHIVTSLPGLNLHRYLKQRVGVVGRRSYDQRLKLNQVEAERLVVLESGRR